MTSTSEAIASSIWPTVLAPTNAAVTAGLLRNQASANCARLTPRTAATTSCYRITDESRWTIRTRRAIVVRE